MVPWYAGSGGGDGDEVVEEAPHLLETDEVLDELFDQALVIGEGRPYLSILVSLNQDQAQALLAAELVLTAQACDDKICLAPAFLPVKVKLTVE